MKRLKLFFTTLVFAGMALQLSAQSSDEECKKQYVILQDNVKDKSYEFAMPALKYLLDSCLTVSTGLYIYGEQMLWHYLSDSTQKDRWPGLMDTLDILFNRRLEAAAVDSRYGKPAYIEGRRLRTYAKFRTQEVDLVHEQARKAVEMGGVDTEAEVMYLYMQYTAFKRRQKKVECEDVIDVYTLLADYIEENLERYEDKDSVKFAHYTLAQTKVDQLAGPCLTCESLVEIYKREFEAKKSDPGWIRKAAAALDKKKCMQQEQYKKDPILISIFTRNVELDPSPAGYWLLARLHVNANNCKESLEAFKSAFEMEPNESPKKMVYGKAYTVQTYACGDQAGARRLARRLLEIQPNFGWAYMFIGDLYANSVKQCAGEDNCTAAAALWAAADKYNQAKNVDPSLDAEIRKRLASVASRFPTKADCFFKDLREGDNFTVGCWIGETTTVRTRD